MSSCGMSAYCDNFIALDPLHVWFSMQFVFSRRATNRTGFKRDRNCSCMSNMNENTGRPLCKMADYILYGPNKN